MIEILAEIGPEGVGVGVGGSALVLIVTMLVKRGVTGTFSIGGGKARSAEVCPLHESTMQLLGERKQNADDDRADIKRSIGELKVGTEKGFDRVFTKLDALHASVKKGQGRVQT